MRLIGTFETEKQAFAFYSFLLKEGVQNIYESFADTQSGKRKYRLWIYDEDDFQVANDWLEHYKLHPEDPQFQEIGPALASSPLSTAETAQEEQAKWQSVPPLRVKARPLYFTLTHFVLFLCAAVFLWNSMQKEQIEKHKGALAAYIAHTALEKELLFDYPAYFRNMDAVVDKYAGKDLRDVKEIPAPMKSALEEAEKTPSWRGLYNFILSAKKEGWKKASNVPLFEKIRQGQVWRLFTPCLLHFDFLHILFNMAWLWILGKQIEEKIHWKKMGLMILIIGIVSNTAQYMMSGPSFLGFSGVILGMAGFIWMRQRQAPWEGYMLSRVVLLFLLLFVLAMVVLGFLAFTLKLFSVLEITPIIANTAHVVGGLCGILLGKLSFFARGKKI